MIETGINFDEIHSFYDLNLILSGVSIPPATPKTTYTDVPGMDGALDFTEVHGEVKYYDREGCKFTFTMNPADDLSESAWEEKKTEVSNILNGRVFKITLDKDPDYYYTGRCTVSEYLSDKRVRQIVVTARLNPWKFKQEETVKVIALTETAQTVSILNDGRKTVCPVIECSDDNCKIVFGSASFVLGAGSYKILDIGFVKGINTLELSGTGTVTFRFRECDM